MKGVSSLDNLALKSLPRLADQSFVGKKQQK